MHSAAQSSQKVARENILAGHPAVARSHFPDQQVFKFVPVVGVGALVESCLRAGMKKISVIPNAGGNSCTLTIEP